MNLQDELTPEFLNWVYGGGDIADVQNKPYENNEIKFSYYINELCDVEYGSENLDTLARLVEEKICGGIFTYSLIRVDSAYVIKLYDGLFHTKHEFVFLTALEAYIACGKYVMEKMEGNDD